jgi:tRNA (mo5U34)-methyltransferase
MDARSLEQLALEFQRELTLIKQRISADFPWYPYETLSNIGHLRPLIESHAVHELVRSESVLDIGGADGDLAFFFERLGYQVTVIDHVPTNYNAMQGLRLLHKHLRSSVIIRDIDLDSYFTLPKERYGLVFFLGILYHLKNPFYALEALARITRNLVLTTRVARFSPNGQRIEDIPLAYLLGPSESNNDATNFWVFSPSGLLRLFDRTGWNIVAYRSIGDTATSEPARLDRDERAIAILSSRQFPEKTTSEDRPIDIGLVHPPNTD